MNRSQWYFSLKCKGSNVFHQNGEQLNLTERTVNIGDTVDCDVRYESGDYQPEYYATILRNEDGQSWRIVQRSSQTNISIEGKGPIGYACQLADGDIIKVEGQSLSLQFHVHHDDLLSPKSATRRLIPWLVAALCLLGTIYALVYPSLRGNREEAFSIKDVEAMEASIYQVKVDSVQKQLLHHNKLEFLGTLYPSEGTPTGTAFLTSNGLMVTARHCVEYWIGTNLNLTTKVEDLAKNHIIRWAIETETFNQTHSTDSVMQLRVFFSFYDFVGDKKYSFSSTDSCVHINRQNDGVFMLADFSEDYYWRSIRPYFNNRKMELGDILWIDGISEQGSVPLAATANLHEMGNGTQLMICGYPMTGTGSQRMTITDGVIRQKKVTGTENLYFESNINHGFSGGPVFIKTRDGVAAVGVVSRVDSVSSGLYKWAVPITMITSHFRELQNKEGGSHDK